MNWNSASELVPFVVVLIFNAMTTMYFVTKMNRRNERFLELILEHQEKMNALYEDRIALLEAMIFR
jgi:hypothetical protein